MVSVYRVPIVALSVFKLLVNPVTVRVPRVRFPPIATSPLKFEIPVTENAPLTVALS